MIRAGETITIPSPIDVHAHLREPGGEAIETIDSGTLAALAGGYQAVIDMPNNPAPYQTRTLALLREKKTIAKHSSHTDIGFYAGVNLEDPDFNQIPGLVSESVGLKLYMGQTTGNTKTYDLDAAREVIDEWIDWAGIIGRRAPILLHAREDIGSDTAAYIASRGHAVHWCHIATESETRAAARLTAHFPELYTGGVTPHHLTMTQRNADFQQGWNGARMQPPLGDEVDADALLHAYNQGNIQILETDHAPHTAKDKIKAEAENPAGETSPGSTTCYGVSGIEFVLPVMMALVQRGKISLERLTDSLHTQPIRMLGAKNLGSIVLGSTTELAVAPYVIDHGDIVGKSANTPYSGWTGWARPISMTRGGKTRHNLRNIRRRLNDSVNVLPVEAVI